jgi:hypothetical protein
MKRLIIIILLLSCLSSYGFAQVIDIGNPVIGYFSYGISLDPGNVIHTFGQEVLFLSSGGIHAAGFGVKINFKESNYVFFTGYRYSLFFFSFGGNILVTDSNFGISPGIEFIIPFLVFVNFKIFFNYNIYFLPKRNPALPEIGLKVSIMDFFTK